MHLPRQPLTAKQASVLAYIRDYAREQGFSVSTRDIAQWLGQCQTSAMQCVTALERKGYIRRAPGIARSITVL